MPCVRIANTQPDTNHENKGSMRDDDRKIPCVRIANTRVAPASESLKGEAPRNLANGVDNPS